MAVRDAAKALGFSSGQQDAWSKQIDGWAERDRGRWLGPDIPKSLVALAEQLLGAPRHLGIHSGGMVLTERPIGEVVPIERARMENRTVLQWDKDGCESMGLVKFDLLGLGMLGALDHMMRLIEQHLGTPGLWRPSRRRRVPSTTCSCRADSIGVFQVECRAQIGTLPRLKPRCFYDLAIEIALIRPGPIQGGAVHPYIRRTTGEERVTYDHPSLKPVLERTLGVPLFQEQLMAMAVTLGDCTRDDADLLRRAMGSKRGVERIEKIKEKLYAGMARRGLVGDAADAIYVKILSFAELRIRRVTCAQLRAAGLCLLLVQAALSGGVPHRTAPQPADGLLLTPVAGGRRSTARRGRTAAGHWVVAGAGGPRADDAGPLSSGPDRSASIRRRAGGPPGPRRGARDRHRARRANRHGATACAVPGSTDLSRRAGLTSTQLEALATAGAFDGFGLGRREALWMAGFAESSGQLEGSTPEPCAPRCRR